MEGRYRRAPVPRDGTVQLMGRIGPQLPPTIMPRKPQGRKEDRMLEMLKPVKIMQRVRFVPEASILAPHPQEHKSQSSSRNTPRRRVQKTQKRCRRRWNRRYEETERAKEQVIKGMLSRWSRHRYAWRFGIWHPAEGRLHFLLDCGFRDLSESAGSTSSAQ